MDFERVFCSKLLLCRQLMSGTSLPNAPIIYCYNSGYSDVVMYAVIDKFSIKMSEYFITILGNSFTTDFICCLVVLGESV